MRTPAGPPCRSALLTWLGELVTYCVTAKGLATALAHDGDPVGENSCATAIGDAAGPLLRRAVAEGAVAPDVTAMEMVSLIVGIAMVTEHHRQPTASAERSFTVAAAGISPARAT
ncbi:hypothetical protein V1227_03220 [Lentzea sp. DG1S-22]|uniref:SbtR family transcriptional regulator n=1 Tax=Lentzea sp. DG1S-22 TaxID=3108822 RepID=UPI002E77A49C|nr:hypothetical protein [Lentzea sp. DG1S-22]WVH81781.1 hypothetical protein V1227_03220 [Lentzea sp. DG1S-22]